MAGAAQGGKAGSAFWRQAGLSYLQYLGIASKAVRNSLKEPAKSRAMARSHFSYNKTIGTDATKTNVTKFI